MSWSNASTEKQRTKRILEVEQGTERVDRSFLLLILGPLAMLIWEYLMSVRSPTTGIYEHSAWHISTKLAMPMGEPRPPLRNVERALARLRAFHLISSVKKTFIGRSKKGEPRFNVKRWVYGRVVGGGEILITRLARSTLFQAKNSKSYKSGAGGGPGRPKGAKNKFASTAGLSPENPPGGVVCVDGGVVCVDGGTSNTSPVGRNVGSLGAPAPQELEKTSHADARAHALAPREGIFSPPPGEETGGEDFLGGVAVYFLPGCPSNEVGPSRPFEEGGATTPQGESETALLGPSSGKAVPEAVSSPLPPNRTAEAEDVGSMAATLLSLPTLLLSLPTFLSGVDPMTATQAETSGPPSVLTEAPYPVWVSDFVATLPNPPVFLPEVSAAKRAHELAQLIAGAFHARMAWPMHPFGRKALHFSGFWRPLLASVEALTERGIAPAAWIAWRQETWEGEHPDSPLPPLAYILDPGAIRRPRGWFANQARQYVGGIPSYTDGMREFMRRQADLHDGLNRMGRPYPEERLRPLLDRTFPGTTWVDLIEKARQDAKLMQESMDEQVKRGIWVWSSCVGRVW